MPADCCGQPCNASPKISPRFRRALWAALWINAGMFAVEVAGSLHSGSVALLADAADFLGDAANYAISLAVLGMAGVWRSRAALVKGFTMGVYGLGVMATSVAVAIGGVAPEPISMGAIAVCALVANCSVAVMLYAFRDGDANMRSVWLCSRNDAIGNVAVMVAALGVFGTGSVWPDVAVAALMAVLALTAAASVIRQSFAELSAPAARA